MLTETAPPVIGQPILDELTRHLKVPTPIDEATNLDAESALHAAIAHLEAQLGLALIERSFVWQGRLVDGAHVRAPIGPISEIQALHRLSATGETVAVDLASVRLDPCDLRTRVVVQQPITTVVQLTFTAGFGPEWSDVPADLRRAILMLAAHYFDTRHDVGESGVQTLHGVAALIAGWRPLRVGMEGAP